MFHNRYGIKTDFAGTIGQLSQDAQKDRPARPQRVKSRGVPLGYVEGLNDARTKLADFFSILLDIDGDTWPQKDKLEREGRQP